MALRAVVPPVGESSRPRGNSCDGRVSKYETEAQRHGLGPLGVRAVAEGGDEGRGRDGVSVLQPEYAFRTTVMRPFAERGLRVALEVDRPFLFGAVRSLMFQTSTRVVWVRGRQVPGRCAAH